MNGDRPRVEIIPLWREEPDARLFAVAVVEMVKARRDAIKKQTDQGEPEVDND
jgi:hypothetical protein